MLVRASAKFRHQYVSAFETGNLPVQAFPGTWNVDILGYGREQLLVLASEEYTLFSVMVATSRSHDIECFLTPFRERLLELFDNFKIRSDDLPNLGLVRVAGRSDRKIIGSQGDLLFLTRAFLEGSEKPASAETLRGIEERINAAPMSYLMMETPLDAFRKRARSMSERFP